MSKVNKVWAVRIIMTSTIIYGIIKLKAPQCGNIEGRLAVLSRYTILNILSIT